MNTTEQENVPPVTVCPVSGYQRNAVDDIFEEQNCLRHKEGASKFFGNDEKKAKISAGSIDEQILKVIAQIYNAVKNNDPATLAKLLEQDGSDFDIFEFRDA
jgi:hypothetical protein